MQHEDQTTIFFSVLPLGFSDKLLSYLDVFFFSFSFRRTSFTRAGLHVIPPCIYDFRANFYREF